jgi:hypothetical protein
LSLARGFIYKLEQHHLKVGLQEAWDHEASTVGPRSPQGNTEMKAELISFPTTKSTKNAEMSRDSLEGALASARVLILELEHENFDLRNLCADLALENRSLGVSNRSDAVSLGRSECATMPG